MQNTIVIRINVYHGDFRYIAAEIKARNHGLTLGNACIEFVIFQRVVLRIRRHCCREATKNQDRQQTQYISRLAFGHGLAPLFVGNSLAVDDLMRPEGIL